MHVVRLHFFDELFWQPIYSENRFFFVSALHFGRMQLNFFKVIVCGFLQIMKTLKKLYRID